MNKNCYTMDEVITIISHTYSACLDGFSPFEVRIECYVGRGLPSFKIVGLPDAGVKEAMDRIYSAIRTSGLEMPCSKVVVNLSPSDLKKVGTHLDLPICMALLSAAGNFSKNNYEQGKEKRIAYFGELSLYGELVSTPGIIPLLLGLSERGFTHFVVPQENAEACRAIRVGHIMGVRNIEEALLVLSGEMLLAETVAEPLLVQRDYAEDSNQSLLDYADVRGCEEAKRVMEIAAAGRHHTLLIGAPGAGKTMLVSRINGILPDPTWEEILQITRIHSMAGLKREGIILERPFRNPHYSISQVGFIGGYARLMPGEVSLAHNGVLFLDEMAEFKRDVLESLRTLLDQRSLLLRRGKRVYEIPCDFILMAATNPCPCGYYGSHRECICRESERERYRSRISGPVADRIDLKIVVGHSGSETKKTISTAEMKARVQKAWQCQVCRNPDYGVLRNSDLSGEHLIKACRLGKKASQLLEQLVEKWMLSKRTRDKILSVARTIADLDEKTCVDEAAIREAALYNGALDGRLG